MLIFPFTSETDVKAMWKNLSDTYRSVRRSKNLNVSGSAGQKPKKEWPFYKKMMFLDPYIVIGSTVSNYSKKVAPRATATMSKPTVPEANDAEQNSYTSAVPKPTVPIPTTSVPSTSGSVAFNLLTAVESSTDTSSSHNFTENDTSRRETESETTESDKNDEFETPVQKKRRLDQQKHDHMTNKILKVLDGLTEPKLTSNKTFFDMLAGEANSLEERQQMSFKVGCLKLFEQIKYSNDRGSSSS